MAEALTTEHSGEPAIDGRIARRQRNLDAVLDVVLEMFAEDMMFPSIEQASKRSGLSMRSLYRYFADPAELVEAAIKRSQTQAAELTHLPHIGQGPFAERLDDFVSMRLRLYEANGAMFRATIHNAANSPRVRDEMRENRRLLREQFLLQFNPELNAGAQGPRVGSRSRQCADTDRFNRPAASRPQPHGRRGRRRPTRCPDLAAQSPYLSSRCRVTAAAAACRGSHR